MGFDPQYLVFVRVDVDGAGLNDERKFQFLQDAMRRLQADPGVTSGDGFLSDAAVRDARTERRCSCRDGPIAGGRAAYNSDRDDINRVIVAPNYFATLGIPMAAGRAFTDRDDSRAPQVAIINEAAARKFFANENPIGRRFGYSPDDSGKFEIVGILRDVRYNSLREPPPPTLYVTYLQTNRSDLVFTVRTAVDPATSSPRCVRLSRGVDPNIPDRHGRNADVARSSGVMPRKECWLRPTRFLAASRCSSPRSVCSA